MSKPDKPLTLAHLLRGKGAVRGAVNKLTWTTGTTPELRRAIATELAALAQKALRVQRPRGSRNKHSEAVRRHVESLVRDHPQATHKELYLLAERDKIDKPDDLMPPLTFRTYVIAARKKLGIKARPGPRR